MRKIILHSFIMLAFPVMANAAAQQIEFAALANPLPPNTIVKQHVSSIESGGKMKLPQRTSDYPTQIVRMQANVQGPPKTCDEVFEKIDAFFTNHITYDKFFYNTILYCGYNPDTNYAVTFNINSYFDPLDDYAVAYLEKYISQHNGKKLLGSTFNVESAKGVVVSLNIDAGVEDDKDSNALYRLQHDNAGIYYSNNLSMRLDLTRDIYERFYSTDPDLILPFINTWFKTSVMLYERVLSQSNYAELMPELVFIMENEPNIFTPNLRLYFSHHCSGSENQHCL